MKVAVIDDDPDLLGVMKLLLETGGFDAVTAGGGEEGLDLVRRETPDIVLLDIMMPDIDGIEVCRRLKADERTRDISVLFVTARTGEDYAAEAMGAGGSGYMVKPFKASELLEKIAEIAGGAVQAE